MHITKAVQFRKEMMLEYINLWEQKCPAIFTGWNIEGQQENEDSKGLHLK